MNKDRSEGAAKQAVGDAKLTAEGLAEKVEGKVQSVVVGVQDTLNPEAPT